MDFLADHGGMLVFACYAIAVSAVTLAFVNARANRRVR